MDALIYADMTTGPDGQRLDFEIGVAEILEPYRLYATKRGSGLAALRCGESAT